MTIAEWLSTIPSAWKRRIEERMKEQGKTSRLSQSTSTLAQAISDAMLWRETAEGDKYWRDIEEEVSKDPDYLHSISPQELPEKSPEAARQEPLTLSEWFRSKIPFRWHDHIVAEVKRQGKTCGLEEKRSTLAEAVDCAFTWAETPEGHDYWSDLKQQLRKNERLLDTFNPGETIPGTSRMPKNAMAKPAEASGQTGWIFVTDGSLLHAGQRIRYCKPGTKDKRVSGRGYAETRTVKCLDGDGVHTSGGTTIFGPRAEGAWEVEAYFETVPSGTSLPTPSTTTTEKKDPTDMKNIKYTAEKLLAIARAELKKNQEAIAVRNAERETRKALIADMQKLIDSSDIKTGLYKVSAISLSATVPDPRDLTERLTKIVKALEICGSAEIDWNDDVELLLTDISKYHSAKTGDSFTVYLKEESEG